MVCPRCKATQLKETKTDKGGTKLDICPQCRGIWFDEGELDRFLRVGVKKLTLPTGAAPAGLECPRCKVTLYNFDYPGTRVGVDLCRKCGGMWLDGGEFGKIKAARRAVLGDRATAGRGGLLSRILSIFKGKPKA